MNASRLSFASWDVSIVRWHCFCHSAHSQNWFHSQHATFASLNHHSVTINVRLPASSCKNQLECSEKCGLLEWRTDQINYESENNVITWNPIDEQKQQRPNTYGGGKNPNKRQKTQLTFLQRFAGQNSRESLARETWQISVTIDWLLLGAPSLHSSCFPPDRIYICINVYIYSPL